MSWLAAQAPSRPGASRLSVGGIGGGIDAVGASKSSVGGSVNHISGAAAAAAAALSMYDDLPEGDVSIEEFEVAAIDRLRGKERERREERIKGNKMIDAREEEERAFFRKARKKLDDKKTSVLSNKQNKKTVLKGIEEAKAKGLKISAVEVKKERLITKERKGGGKEF